MEFSETQLKEDIKLCLEKENYELIDLTVNKFKATTVIQIYSDKQGGIAVEDCAHLSREVNKVLELKYANFDNYQIEVSSPGIKRPLKKEKDFLRNLNRNVFIQFMANDQKTSLEGSIHHTTNKVVYIQHDGKIDCIDYEQILNAKLKIKW